MDRLEEARLAERVPEANDRRRLLVRPPEMAWRQIQGIWGPIEDEGTRLLAGYTIQQLLLLQSFLHPGIQLQRKHTGRLQRLEAEETPPEGPLSEVS